MIAIETHELTRTFVSYKKAEGLKQSLKGFFNREHIIKHALHETNLKIEKGQIVGLVGSNGAGKTTLLKILSGLIHPTSGYAKVLGYTPFDRKSDFLKQISILLGQKNQLWWDLPAADSFNLLASIYELDKIQAKKRYLELSEMLKCQDQLHIQLRRLSLGERMKMEIIGALLHKPQVLFLDEPTIGLDIVAQNAIREFLSGLVKIEKPTIILTSHYMDDISKLSDRLLLISKGSIVYDGTVQNFTQKSESKQKIYLVLSEPLKADVEFLDNKFLAGSREIHFSGKSETVGPFVSFISKLGEIVEIKTEETDFEDVIHQFMQKTLHSS